MFEQIYWRMAAELCPKGFCQVTYHYVANISCMIWLEVVVHYGEKEL